MERADLLTANGAIFTVQGKAIAENAKENVKVLPLFIISRVVKPKRPNTKTTKS